MGGENKKAGREALRSCEVGARCEHCAEVHGTFVFLTSILVNDAKLFQNITAFLMTQNQQFEGAIVRLNYAKESLDPARSNVPLLETILRLQGV